MGRKPRIDVAGGISHVYARGNAKGLIFVDDQDRQVYLQLLARTVGWTGWSVLSFCLMPNHVHLVVETPRANLSSGMRDHHGRYGRAFNDRHDRVGHVFQGRFGSVPIRDERQLWTVLSYVARNPVKAGLAERPEAWRWSSHAMLTGGRRPQWLAEDRLFELAGGSLAGYVDLVEIKGQTLYVGPELKGLTL